MYESAVFDEIYQDYLNQLSEVDLGFVKDRLGIDIDGETAIIPVYGIPHRVAPGGIVNSEGLRPSHSASVLLCKYLLMCPESEPAAMDWVAYRDFKDSAPFVYGFRENVELPIGRFFSGRIADLKKAAETFGGRTADVGVSSDLVMVFDALPRVPVLMLFNDEDEDFPAQCSVLFQGSAEKYLDMECIVIAGWILAEWLQSV